MEIYNIDDFSSGSAASLSSFNKTLSLNNQLIALSSLKAIAEMLKELGDHISSNTRETLKEHERLCVVKNQKERILHLFYLNLSLQNMSKA